MTSKINLLIRPSFKLNKTLRIKIRNALSRLKRRCIVYCVVGIYMKETKVGNSESLSQDSRTHPWPEKTWDNLLTVSISTPEQHFCVNLRNLFIDSFSSLWPTCCWHSRQMFYESFIANISGVRRLTRWQVGGRPSLLSAILIASRNK